MLMRIHFVIGGDTIADGRRSVLACVNKALFDCVRLRHRKEYSKITRCIRDIRHIHTWEQFAREQRTFEFIDSWNRI